MKRRNKVISFLILMAISCSSVNHISTLDAKAVENKNIVEDNLNQKEEVNEKQNLKISVLSDIHYFSQSMIKECDDFNKEKSRDRKLLEESSSILDSALEKVKKEKPDVLLISGDLTKDGELKGHKEVAEKLMKLKNELKGLKIYLINGNHDINNSYARDFSSGKAVNTTKTTVNDFKKIYKEFTTKEAISTFLPSSGQAGSLSYVVSPKKGYTIIAVDSCKYSSEVTKSKKNEHETSGAISNELKNWVIDNAKKAKEKGDTVILLEHHGIVPHFEAEPKVMKAYLIDNYDEINKEFADAGITYAFTGHMHGNDISKLTTDKGNKLYDIETGSAVTYPCPTRLVEFSKEKSKESVKVNTKLIDTINYVDKSTGKKITDLKNYGYKSY